MIVTGNQKSFLQKEVAGLRIGIIGARSRHLDYFRRAVAGCFPEEDFSITHLYAPDAPELVPLYRELVVCTTPQELIASSDAVIIALREGTQHAALALMAMMQGKPVFVDKPFACAPEDAQRMLAYALERGVPCTGGSTLCFTPEVRRLARELPPAREYTLSYQADPFSPYGGWYFYGSHLGDLCIALFGENILEVSAELSCGCVAARVRYPSFTVTLRSTPEVQAPILTAGHAYVLDNGGCYEAGMRHFHAVARGEEEGCAARLCASVRLVDAVFTSLRTGRPAVFAAAAPRYRE